MDTYVVGRGRHRGYETVRFERVLRAPVTRRRNAGWDSSADLPTPLFNGHLQRSGDSRTPIWSTNRSEAIPLAISTLIIGAVFAVALSVCTFADGKPADRDVDTGVQQSRSLATQSAEVAATTAAAPESAPISSVDRLFVSDQHLPPAPEITANAYLVVDSDTGEVLAQRNSETRVPIASLTKIATALAVLSMSPVDRIVEIQRAAAAMPPSRMGLIPGDQLSVEQLLFGLMLDSGNDAAYALGDGVGGVDRLVAEMNSIAENLGLRSTHFSNPAGFDDPDNYSTARELFALTEFALDSQPLIRKIAGTSRKVIESDANHGWYAPTNLNRLLTEYPGAFGVKTGWTEDSGYTLVVGSKQHGRTLFAVVLGAEKHFTDASSLLDYGFSIYDSRPAPRG